MYADENIVYRMGDRWYANLICPVYGDPLIGKKEDITDLIEYDRFDNIGINDAMVTATKIITKGEKHALFTFYSYTSMTTGMYICDDPDPFVYDEIHVFGDWSKWDDYGYAACRSNDQWTLIKVTQFPDPKSEVIRKGLTSLMDALASVGVNSLEGFRQIGDFWWEKQ